MYIYTSPSSTGCASGAGAIGGYPIPSTNPGGTRPSPPSTSSSGVVVGIVIIITIGSISSVTYIYYLL